MSAVNLKTLRAVRRVQVTGLAFAGADLPLVIVGGSLGLLLAAVFVTVAWAALICAQTQLIRRREYLDRPRPDYSAIARLEMPIWGRTFEHAGAPGAVRSVRMVAGQTLMCKRCMAPYARVNGVCVACYGARRRGQELGAFGTVAAVRRDRKERNEHRSNLRWERPS